MSEYRLLLPLLAPSGRVCVRACFVLVTSRVPRIEIQLGTNLWYFRWDGNGTRTHTHFAYPHAVSLPSSHMKTALSGTWNSELMNSGIVSATSPWMTTSFDLPFALSFTLAPDANFLPSFLAASFSFRSASTVSDKGRNSRRPE